MVKASGTENEDTQYFKSAYKSLEEQYQAKAALIRQIGQEGTILLKNENNALPMKTGTILVLGGSKFVLALSHGGGAMNAADMANATTVEQALAFDGLQVITEGASADAALVIIGRSAGEGADLPDGKLVLTSCVAAPKYVRYAWQGFTRANLVNGDALPASTFRAEISQ